MRGPHSWYEKSTWIVDEDRLGFVHGIDPSELRADNEPRNRLRRADGAEEADEGCRMTRQWFAQSGLDVSSVRRWSAGDADVLVRESGARARDGADEGVRVRG